MNQRIKELAVAATTYAIEFAKREDPMMLDAAFVEKFAELIVRECVGIVAKRKDQAIDDGCNVDEAMSMAEMDLEEHFGVEELEDSTCPDCDADGGTQCGSINCRY